MGDLVTVLRDHARLTNLTGGYPEDHPPMAGQAADEIERLRKTVRDSLMAVEAIRDGRPEFSLGSLQQGLSAAVNRMEAS